MIINYFLENEYREYLLVPLTLLNNDFEYFNADFEVYVGIKNYADQCITFDKKNSSETLSFTTCASNMHISVDNFKRQKLWIECMTFENHSCLIRLICSGCKIDKNSYITLDFNGKLAYSSGIFVNFTSFSLVSNTIQSSFSEIYPQKKCVFTGKTQLFSHLLFLLQY